MCDIQCCHCISVQNSEMFRKITPAITVLLLFMVPSGRLNSDSCSTRNQVQASYMGCSGPQSCVQPSTQGGIDPVLLVLSHGSSAEHLRKEHATPPNINSPPTQATSSLFIWVWISPPLGNAPSEPRLCQNWKELGNCLKTNIRYQSSEKSEQPKITLPEGVRNPPPPPSGHRDRKRRCLPNHPQSPCQERMLSEDALIPCQQTLMSQCAAVKQ